MKILLVDDDLELGTMLSEYLTGEGFNATLVLTGKAGVEGALVRRVHRDDPRHHAAGHERYRRTARRA